MPSRRLSFLSISIILSLAFWLAAAAVPAFAGSLWIEDWDALSRPSPANQGLPPTGEWNFHTYNLWVQDENGDPVPGPGTTDSYSFFNDPAYGDTLVMQGNSWGLESKQHFQRGAPLSVEAYVKVSATTPNTTSFAGITVYTGEKGPYEEIVLYDDCQEDSCGDGGNLRLYRFTKDTLQNLSPEPLDHNQRYKLRLAYDGTGTWRYYLDDELVGTVEDRPLDSAPNIFILGIANKYDPATGKVSMALADPAHRVRAEFSEITVAANYNLFSRTSWVDFLSTDNEVFHVDTNNNDWDGTDSVCGWPGLGYPQCDFIQLTMEDPENGSYYQYGHIVTPKISRPLAPDPNGPDLALTWGEVLFNTTGNQYGDITIQVLDENGNLIPDSVLPGNGAALGNGYGFRSSPIRLSKLDPAVYNRVRLRANLSTTNTAYSPWLLDWTLTFGKRSYFSWYDMESPGMKDWLLMSNSSIYSTSSHFEGQLGDRPKFYASAPPGSSAERVFPGVMDGPLMVNSLSGLPQVISQRILFDDLLQETLAVPEEKLSDVYYWPWYDMQTPGYKNWIVISNPDPDTPVYYLITMPGVDAGTEGARGMIEPGGRVTPFFPGIMGGPVRLQTWAADPVTETPIPDTPARVIASQRVLMFGGEDFSEVDAFNELIGIPRDDLSDRYLWTWYDNQSAGAKNWVLVANPGPAAVGYRISIAGGCDEDPVVTDRCLSGDLEPVGDPDGKDRVTPIFEGQMGGPVEVQAWDLSDGTPADVISTQRILWGDSFEEVPGYPYEDLFSSYHWTWYDQESPASRNWVVVTNPSPNEKVTVRVMIGGIARGSYDLPPGGGTITPIYQGMIGGPVEVRAHVKGGDYADPADRRPVLASQRVLWNGNLNEVMGTVLEP